MAAEILASEGWGQGSKELALTIKGYFQKNWVSAALSARYTAERSERAPTCTLCCVVDEHPRFHVELVLWALCARRHLPQDTFRCVVYTVGDVPADLIAWVQSLGISTQRTETVVEGSPHANKIAPFFYNHLTDLIAVCDTDLFFVDDPIGLLKSDRFRAAPNNACNPPAHIFRTILLASGLNRPYRPGISLFRGIDGRRETHINNVSAGIIVAPSRRANELARRWKKWALWLVENRNLLDRWAVHVDQVAFALALEELGEDVEFLPPQVNAILHLLEEVSSCIAVHLTTGHIPSFPERFNADRTLKADGLSEGVAEALERLNRSILDATKKIAELRSTREHYDKFLNPFWTR